MLKSLKLGKIREIIHTYIGYDGLSEDTQELATDAIDAIFDATKTVYGEHNDDTNSNTYAITLERMLASNDYTFDCFLYDNKLELAFADMSASHESIRASLLILHLIHKKQATAEQINVILYGIPNSTALCAEIYTGLALGVYESGAWGGRSVICSSDYPFAQLNQLALKSCSNLSPIIYSKAQAENDLSKMLDANNKK